MYRFLCRRVHWGVIFALVRFTTDKAFYVIFYGLVALSAVVEGLHTFHKDLDYKLPLSLLFAFIAAATHLLARRVFVHHVDFEATRLEKGRVMLRGVFPARDVENLIEYAKLYLTSSDVSTDEGCLVRIVTFVCLVVSMACVLINFVLLCAWMIEKSGA